MRLVSALAGLQPSSADRPPIYTDTVSWAAGGARSVPLYEYLISEVVDRRDQYDAVVFEYEWYQSFVGRIPTFTGEPIDVGERQRRMARLLDGLAFAGALQENFGAADRNQSRLWFARDPSAAPAFARIGPDGELSVARGEVAVNTVLDSPGGSAGGRASLQLPAGSYFGMATSSGPEFLRLALVAGETPLATGIPSVSLPQEQVGAILWFTLTDADANVTLQADTEGQPGPISVRIWRTAWTPADTP
jgi:hypothetical protein